MRARARQFNPTSVPENLRLDFGQYLLTPGSEYEVHAVAVYEGVVIFQVAYDSPHPDWYPAWAFDITDSSIPSDWIFSTFRDEPSLVMGPKFVAESIEAYSAMVELEKDQVERFWQRVDSLRKSAVDESD